MTSSASAGFDQGQGTRRCGGGIKSPWSVWEIGAMVAGFVVFWPLGLVALFLKWKNGEMWKGSATASTPWAGFKAPDFSSWQGYPRQRSGFGFSNTGNAAFDEYKRSEIERLEAERRKLEDEQKAFYAFVEKVRRAKDQEEFDRFMAERRSVSDQPQGDAS